MYLNAHSYYSLRYGTLSPEDLVKESSKRGIKAIALTDINNSTGIPDFVKLCRKEKIKPVPGIDFRDGDQQLYIGLAENNEGFRELNSFLSRHNLTGTPLPQFAPAFKNVWVIYPFGSRLPDNLRDNEFIGIPPYAVRKLLSSKLPGSKMVILQNATFTDKEGYEVHCHLRAIDHNTLLSKLKPHQCTHPEDKLLQIDQLIKSFDDHPDIIRNTEKIISACSFDFDYKSCKNKKTFTGNVEDDRLLLEKLAMDGLDYRYGKENSEAATRIKHELNIIYELGFSSYFLITWDIIRYSMNRGFYHVGRGSGANSIVAYCLKITNVDPIELNLYFERFLNPKRTSPPDFDIDYSWKERDEVLDYIFKRYGRKHTALLGTISTFRSKSILRELGKVYGLPKAEIDALINNPSDELNRNDITGKIFAMGIKIVDFPNMRSIHAGGILISEEPITCYTALDLPPKGYPTTQWDMYVAEDIGFEKLDILSQRGIGHIKESVEIIGRNRGVKVDAHAIQDFKKDREVIKLLRKGETNGCFYVESPAMRGLLVKLQCDNYLNLVAASSVIRPGVARSGMMREYIRRLYNPNSFDYIHPVMKEQLSETFGVMVYQEDVLKVCHHFAGLDLADADVLRRAMSGKFRSKAELRKIVDKFFSNCKARGYPDNLTKEVWRQIESFAGYSFSKAHSASYAVESFQSLYLKAHFPLEFMVAVINNFGGFYRTWVYVNEARRWGASIELPCINSSLYKTTISGKIIYLGFVHIENLERNISKKISDEHKIRGEYKGLEDFVQRIHPGIEQLTLLIRINAFRFTRKSKKELLWQAYMLFGKGKKSENSPALFSLPAKKFKLPELEQSNLEDAFDEIELLGFPVTVSYFNLLKTSFRGEIKAKNMNEKKGRKVRMVGHLVTIKYIKTVKKEWMHFAAFIDDTGGFFDTVHFPRTLKRYPFRGSGTYLILGKVIEEFGFPSVEVIKMAKLATLTDPRY